MDMTTFGTYTKFENLKFVLSNKYFSGSGFRWLKFLLYEHLTIPDITNPDFNTGHDLFNKLEDNGLITQTNVNLLLEVAQLSELKGAEYLVQQYIRDSSIHNIPTDETRLSPKRKQLFKVLRDTDRHILFKIISYYTLKRIVNKEFHNIWDVVLTLEIRKRLELDDVNKVNTFAKLLGPNGRRIIIPGGNNDAQCIAAVALSDITFRNLIADFAKFYDERGYCDWLRVLFIDIVGSVEELRKAKSTIFLLSMLKDSGILSKSDISVLKDTVKITKQLGIEEEIPSYFDNLENHQISNFSPQRRNIYNLGRELRDSDRADLDARINFPPLRNYTDNWSLIFDFEQRKLFDEDHMEPAIKKALEKYKFV